MSTTQDPARGRSRRRSAELESSYHRSAARTPSPTASEMAALRGFAWKRPTLVDLRRLLNVRSASIDTWKKLITVSVALAILIAFFVFQKHIVRALQPATDWMYRTKGGWLIPIAVLIVLSFPPLLGHEIMLILVGFTWGMGIGTGIAFAGTLFGEVITYWVFKLFCNSRQKKLEDSDARYDCLARVVREGGWRMVTVVRYSPIPGHVSTALFATIGIDFSSFLVAAVLALPKQLATVAYGYEVARAGNGPTGSSTMSRIVQAAIAVVLVLVTLGVSYYLNKRQALIIEDVVYKRRKRRQARAVGSEDVGPDVDEIKESVDGLVLVNLSGSSNLPVCATSLDHDAV